MKILISKMLRYLSKIFRNKLNLNYLTFELNIVILKYIVY